MGEIEYETGKLLGITPDDIYGKPASEIDRGFAIICLKCGGKGGNKISLGFYLTSRTIKCSCGNSFLF